MNDTKHDSIDTLRFELVTELLQGLEGEKSIAEMLTPVEKLFIKDVSGKVLIQIRQQCSTETKI